VNSGCHNTVYETRKLEKCKWKVREVGFLGVVIRPEGIRIEEEKVKGVLDWPTLKGIKDV